MKISISMPLEKVRSMDALEWQELIERQEKRLAVKAQRKEKNLLHAERAGRREERDETASLSQ